MALDVQSSLTDQTALDKVLHHHLRLDPHPQEERQNEPSAVSELQNRSHKHKRALSQPPMKFGTQFSRPMVNKSTVEADNKKRPGILKRNAIRYEPPPPEPPDPNSEAKTVTINRMQNSLQEWDKQLKEILQKKEKNDSVYKLEFEDRNKKIKDLSEKYSSEHKVRVKTERQRDKLADKLKNTEEDLIDNKQEVEQLQTELAQYQLAYQEMEIKKTEWENEATIAGEQLEKSEGMRRRLNDQVTELQGQLAIEEQRSKFCAIL